MLTLVLSLIFSTASAACPEPTSAAELTAEVDDSLLSFVTLDEEGFIESSDALLTNLPCLATLIGRADAASIHRTLAMRMFWDGEDDSASAYFRAARRLEPDHLLSDKIAPEGGPLATLYAGAASPAPRTARLSSPSWTTVYVDGERVSERPSDVPAIYQYEVSNELVWTGLLEGSTA